MQYVPEHTNTQLPSMAQKRRLIMSLRNTLVMPTRDRTAPMRSVFDTVTELPVDHGKSLAVLIALVQEALETSDAIGLPLVGIDLCTALEKLKALPEPHGPSGP